MVIYEVNLSVNNLIYKHYIKWLKNHISKMLTFKCFYKYHLYEVPSNNSDQKKICVHYYVDSLEDLEYYFNNYAEEMKLDGLKIFGDNFSASRRILSILE